MKLFLLTQTQNRGYDTYDSCVVAAQTEEEAKLIHPHGENISCDHLGFYSVSIMQVKHYVNNCWANSPEKVSCRYLGEAASNVQSGVICASFNPG